MDNRVGQAAKDDLLKLDPALREKARRWFAEAREQTRRDDEEIAAWRRTPASGGDGGGGADGAGWGDGGGDCGLGD